MKLWEGNAAAKKRQRIEDVQPSSSRRWEKWGQKNAAQTRALRFLTLLVWWFPLSILSLNGWLSSFFGIEICALSCQKYQKLITRSKYVTDYFLTKRCRTFHYGKLLIPELLTYRAVWLSLPFFLMLFCLLFFFSKKAFIFIKEQDKICSSFSCHCHYAS